MVRKSESPIRGAVECSGMSYVDDNLIQGESVQYRASLHWKVVLVPVFIAIVLLGLAGLAFWQAAYSDPGVATALWIVGILLLLAAALRLITLWIVISSAEFAVTNKRVILKTGFIKIKTAEIFLAKVESVGVDQTIVGRVMGYGSVVIRGTGGSLEPFSDISRALEFRRQIQEQIGRSLGTPQTEQL